MELRAELDPAASLHSVNPEYSALTIICLAYGHIMIPRLAEDDDSRDEERGKNKENSNEHISSDEDSSEDRYVATPRDVYAFACTILEVSFLSLYHCQYLPNLERYVRVNHHSTILKSR